MTDDNDERLRRERAEDIEEKRLTRAELLAAQATRTQLALEAHERHFNTINGHIEQFAERLVALEKNLDKRDAAASTQLAGARKQITLVTLVLSTIMVFAAVASILVTVL